MTKVVGLDRKPIDVRTAQMDMDDAATALRDLLGKIDRGEVTVLRWMLIYNKPVDGDEGLQTTRIEDSGMDVAQANYMIDMAKYDLMRRVTE